MNVIFLSPCISKQCLYPGKTDDEQEELWLELLQKIRSVDPTHFPKVQALNNYRFTFIREKRRIFLLVDPVSKVGFVAADYFVKDNEHSWACHYKKVCEGLKRVDVEQVKVATDLIPLYSQKEAEKRECPTVAPSVAPLPPPTTVKTIAEIKEFFHRWQNDLANPAYKRLFVELMNREHLHFSLSGVPLTLHVNVGAGKTISLYEVHSKRFLNRLFSQLADETITRQNVCHFLLRSFAAEPETALELLEAYQEDVTFTWTFTLVRQLLNQVEQGMKQHSSPEQVCLFLLELIDKHQLWNLITYEQQGQLVKMLAEVKTASPLVEKTLLTLAKMANQQRCEQLLRLPLFSREIPLLQAILPQFTGRFYCVKVGILNQSPFGDRFACLLKDELKGLNEANQALLHPHTPNNPSPPRNTIKQPKQLPVSTLTSKNYRNILSRHFCKNNGFATEENELLLKFFKEIKIFESLITKPDEKFLSHVLIFHRQHDAEKFHLICQSLLLVAVQHSQVNTTRLLLNCDVTYPRLGECLVYACNNTYNRKQNAMECVQVLLSAGANPNTTTQSDRETPLRNAISARSLEMVQLLDAWGADLFASHYESHLGFHTSLIDLSYQLGYDEISDYLRQRGVQPIQGLTGIQLFDRLGERHSVHKRNRPHEKALKKIRESYCPQFLKLCQTPGSSVAALAAKMAAGPYPSTLNGMLNLKTYLLVAIQHRREDLVQELVERHHVRLEMFPLHYAVQVPGNLPIVRRLIEIDHVDLSEKNTQGKTPFHYCGDLDIFRYLTTHIASVEPFFEEIVQGGTAAIIEECFMLLPREKWISYMEQAVACTQTLRPCLSIAIQSHLNVQSTHLQLQTIPLPELHVELDHIESKHLAQPLSLELLEKAIGAAAFHLVNRECLRLLKLYHEAKLPQVKTEVARRMRAILHKIDLLSTHYQEVKIIYAFEQLNKTLEEMRASMDSQ